MNRTVIMDCPVCAEEISVEVGWYGRHFKASQTSPEEWPVAELRSEIRCPKGCTLSDQQEKELGEEALAIAECDAEDEASDFDDMSRGPDYDVEAARGW